MEYKQFIALISRRKETILLITAIFLVVVLLFTFLQPLKYRVSSKLLVVQNYGTSADPYSISRSNQFLSNILSQVVYSDSFFSAVINSGYNIDKTIFSQDANKRKKQWQKMVSTRAISDTGMIAVYTYHQDKYLASQVNQAITYILKTGHSQYHGLGDRVDVKVIDNSVASRWPVKPNVLLNTVFGLFFGLAISLIFIYLYPKKSLEFRFRKRKVAANLKDGFGEKGLEPEKQLENKWKSVGEVIIDHEMRQKNSQPSIPQAEKDNKEDNHESSKVNYDNQDLNFRGNINNILRN